MPGRENQFRDWYRSTIEELSRGYLVRESAWSEAAAIGDRRWIDELADDIAIGRKHIGEMPQAPERVGIVHDSTETSYALHVTRRASDPLLVSRR